MIRAMGCRSYRANEPIYRAGDAGYALYIVRSGVFSCTVKDDQGAESVSTLSPGMVFGHECMMYEPTRKDSVKCVDGDSKLWILDRLVYQRILVKTYEHTAEQRSGFLRNIPILAPLDEAQRQAVADALQRINVAAGTKIITQGDEGDAFYIIEEGEVVCREHKGLTAMRESPLRRTCCQPHQCRD